MHYQYLIKRQGFEFELYLHVYLFMYISFSSLTFSSSGSHVSKVKDRTLEKCTPRLLPMKEVLKEKS